MTETTAFDAARDQLIASLETHGAKLAATPPSDLHEFHADVVSAATGLEVDPKVVQAILALHGKIQGSDANKIRPSYRGRTRTSIQKGGATTAERFADTVATAEPVETPTEEKPAPRPARKPRATKATAAASA